MHEVFSHIFLEYFSRRLDYIIKTHDFKQDNLKWRMKFHFKYLISITISEISYIIISSSVYNNVYFKERLHFFIKLSLSNKLQ